MNWFIKRQEDFPDLPNIEEVSSEIPAISEFLDAYRLPEVFKQAGHDTLPVVDMEGKIVGIVSEFDLARIITGWSLSPDSYMLSVSVGDIMTTKVWTETARTNIERILSGVPEMHTRVIPIVEDDGKYTGMSITRTALLDFLSKLVKPASLGGLATPLGVYLTDGLHQSGSKNPGLILTGAVFAVYIYIIDYFMAFIPKTAPESVMLLVSLFLFLIFMRVSPLSKIHAAEHKTINAIEKGFPLAVETVKMQSRIHHRCGTNLMVIIFGFFFIQSLLHDLPLEVFFKSFSSGSLWFIRFILAFLSFLFILSYWKEIGRWVQKYFTTAEPSVDQIKNGIDAGEELLKMHKHDTRHLTPTFASKLFNMGIIQIFLSLIGFMFIFNLIKQKLF